MLIGLCAITTDFTGLHSTGFYYPDRVTGWDIGLRTTIQLFIDMSPHQQFCLLMTGFSV